MRTYRFRVPDQLLAEIDGEARQRGVSRSAVIRERLQRAPWRRESDPLASIRDLIGSVEGNLPSVLSERKNEYLRAIICQRKRPG